MTARMFVAAVPPQLQRDDLQRFAEPRQQRDDPLRWVDAERWHLTLAFLPDVADRQYDDLVDGLLETAKRLATFELAVAGAGAFPNPAKAKVLWSAISGDLAQLDRTAAAVRTSANRAGVQVDGATFRPHLTLARINPPRDVSKWLRVFDLYEGPAWTVSELTLFESHRGGRYQAHETFALGAAPTAEDRWWIKPARDLD